MSDRPNAVAGGHPLEDLADDLGLRWHDLEHVHLVARHRPIAVADAAGVPTARDLAVEAAVRLVAQVVEVHLVDDAAHAPVQLSGGALRVVPVRHADHPHAPVLDAAKQLLGLDAVP